MVLIYNWACGYDMSCYRFPAMSTSQKTPAVEPEVVVISEDDEALKEMEEEQKKLAVRVCFNHRGDRS